MSTVTEELERLNSLHEKGALSDEEFAEAKQKALEAVSASEKTDPVKPREAPARTPDPEASAPGSARPSSELKAVAAALLAAGGAHVASWFYFPSALARQHEVLAVGGIIARLVVPLVVGAILYRKLRGPPDESTADA